MLATISERVVVAWGGLPSGVAYIRTGADRFFVPGLPRPVLIQRIFQNTALPVNAMIKGELMFIRELAELGISRASFGPEPYFDAITDLTEKFKAIV
ncbi:MAG: isocitrate lyase/phosphoenolpyruvate mutase family protein [Granulosicoccus sp.]